MESHEDHTAKPSSCVNSNPPAEPSSSIPESPTSCKSGESPAALPTGSPCVSTGIARPKNLGTYPDQNGGIMLFKARMFLEDRYAEFKQLGKLLYDGGKGNYKVFGLAEIAAAKQMGYVGCDDEITRALVYKAPSPHLEKPSLKVDAKADLEEAYQKFEIPGLSQEDFLRPQAWFWYQQYHDVELRKDVVKLVAANLVAPSAKGKQPEDAAGGAGREESASQMSELERFIRERKGDPEQ